jgi:uncharacterized membrane-anchored protein
MNSKKKEHHLASQNHTSSSVKAIREVEKETEKPTYDAPRLIKSWYLTVRAIGTGPPQLP